MAAIETSAYAVYNKATLDSMAMDPTILGFKAHTEIFSDIGEVDVYVQDLSLRWAFEQERNRDYVTGRDAVYETSFDTDAPPIVVWDHLSDPTKRPQWQRLVDEVVMMTEGRQGLGSVNHCMHGKELIVEHVADWRPFSYITLRYDVGGLDKWAWTYQLDPLEVGTRLTMRLSDPGGDAWSEIGDEMSARVAEQSRQLENLLQDV